MPADPFLLRGGTDRTATASRRKQQSETVGPPRLLLVRSASQTEPDTRHSPASPWRTGTVVPLLGQWRAGLADDLSQRRVLQIRSIT